MDGFLMGAIWVWAEANGVIVCTKCWYGNFLEFSTIYQHYPETNIFYFIKNFIINVLWFTRNTTILNMDNSKT